MVSFCGGRVPTDGAVSEKTRVPHTCVTKSAGIPIGLSVGDLCLKMWKRYSAKYGTEMIPRSSIGTGSLEV